mgnify:CR=1 FL=1
MPARKNTARNFTDESATRIAETVRAVENAIKGEEKTQRRRAGGLGRPTLWETTSASTGGDTPQVWVKRVEKFDSGGSVLIDVGGPKLVYHDPSVSVEEGDRGLVIRQGDGALFFYKYGVAPTVVRITDHCYIDESSPNSTFGFPLTATAYLGWTYSPLVTAENIAVFKLERRITEGPPNGLFTRVVLGRVIDSWIQSQGTSSGSSTIVSWDLYKITDDFDPSTITWNSYAGLAKSLVFSVQGMSVRSFGSGEVIARPLSFGGPFKELSLPGYPTLYQLDLEDAYGLAFRFGNLGYQGYTGYAQLSFRRGDNAEAPFVTNLSSYYP